MFYNCQSLTSINVSNFNTSNTNGIGKMFYGCSSLTSIDLSNFDTKNMTGFDSMIGSCPKLTYVDISSFTTNITELSIFFKEAKRGTLRVKKEFFDKMYDILIDWTIIFVE